MNNLKTYEGFFSMKRDKMPNVPYSTDDVIEYNDNIYMFSELKRHHYFPVSFTFEESKTIALFTGDATYVGKKMNNFSYITYADNGYRIFNSDKSKMKFNIFKYKIDDDNFYTIDFIQKGEPDRYFKAPTLNSCLRKIKEIENK